MKDRKTPSTNRSPSAAPRDTLLDVSRLIWRLWTKRLPTGIDRVCLEYLNHFAERSHAVVQRKGKFLVLPVGESDELFALLSDPTRFSRKAMVAFGARALVRARPWPPRPGMTYLNVGHTGLDQRALPEWVKRNQVKAIYMVHDLIPLTHPEFCRAGESDRHERRMTNLLLSAAGVIGTTRATLDDFATFASSRGLAMPDSVSAWLSGYRPDPRVEPLRLQRPHFVTLGTIEGRKNHLLLLQVWRRLIALHGDKAPILLIVGQRGWEAQAPIAMLDRLPELKPHVRELGRCNDAELAGWIRGARALLMPTFAEGFGLPVIEALQLGSPVIASDLPVFREIAGDIPLYLDPIDGPGWEAAILDYRVNSLDRERQLGSMRNYRAPDWASHFATVEDWLRHL